MIQLYAILRLQLTKQHTYWAFCMLLGMLAFSFTARAQCSITIKPTVSGCYSPDGVASKATVSIEVAWSNAPSGNITVSYMGQTKTITPGPITVNYGFNVGNQPQTIVSPQVVAFEVDLPGATQTATATFDSDPTCTATSAPIVLPAACPRRKCDPGELAGTVFNDFNADGIRQAGESAGIPDVTVTAIDCDGTKYTATTDAFGDYKLTIPAANYPVRVEFTNLPAYAGQGTLNGTDGRTTVQFVQSADCSIDLGVLDPTDYCQTNPKIIVPCYLNGDPNHSLSANDDAIVTLDYALSVASKTGIAKIPDVAAVWGTAYAKKDNSVYTAAVLRRHMGLTDAGLGGIFKTNLATNTTALFVDVETLGVNLGSIPSNADRGLGAKTAPSQDEEAYTKAGKTGMGDLDISGDGNTLYFVNLFEKKLHSLSTTTASPTEAPGVAIPDPGCANGDYRPWALKVYKGSVYVGVVCDAATGSKSELRAYIYKYDISTNAFNTTPVLDFPLTYPKGFPWSGDYNITGWFPWSDNINDPIAIQSSFGRTCCPPQYGDVLIYPQPLLSDIEFDIDGSMVLGFGDRFSFQTGNKNYAPNSSATNGINGSTNYGYSGLVGGDILRAYSNGTTFVLENNAKAGPSVGAGPANNQGPGFGEFYNDNYFAANGDLIHSENANGGLALRPGSGETIYVAMDPENTIGDSGGLRKVSNSSGLQTGAVTITTGFLEVGLFAKAAALGDLEIACATPTYLEIGNRVWLDSDKDGIQDPCEKALAGIKVALYQGNTLLANTTTDANGEYYFSNGSDVNAVSKLLQPNTVYTVRFGTDGTTSQYDAGTDLLTTSLGKFKVTTAFSTAPTANTLNDSNAEISGGFLSANVTTGTYGTVNHTIDAGFYCVIPSIGNKITQTAPTCSGITPNNNGKVTLTAAVTPYDKYRLKTGTGAWTGDTTYANATAIGSTFPIDLVTTAPNAGATYVVRFYTGECCYKDTTITVAPVNCACTQPTLGKVTTSAGTCTSGTPNNNATASVTVTGGDKADIVEGATYGSGPAYNAVSNVTVSAGSANFTNLKHNTQYTIRVWNADNTCFTDVTFTTATINCCVKPVAVTKPKVQTICVGGAITAYTATPSTGVEYTWFGPLADTTSTLGTAISGQTTAGYTPTGTALTTTGTKYYAVVINNTGDITCADTAFVQLVVNAKPVIADGAATICAGEVVDLTSKITNYATLLSPVWTVATAGGTEVTTPTAVKPTTTTTYVLVAQNAAGCKDTANVVVTVNPKPNAGTDQTLDCANAGTNTLTTSTTLVPVTAGGTFTQIGNTPAVATIAGNAVSGMTVAGTYQFQYSVAGCLDTVAVTVEPCTGCVKPNAGTDAPAVCQPITTAKLTAVTAGGTWAPIGSPSNPSAATIDAAGNITGMTAAGTYKFVYSVTGGGITCTDTAQVVVNPKPNAGGDQSICSPITIATLTGTPAGGTWSAMASNPATASVTNAGAVTNMTVSGTYKFIYMLNGCTDTVAVVRKAAITTVNLGPGTICQNESLTYTDADGTNGTWSGPGVSDNGTGASLSAKAALTQLNKPAPVTFYIYYSQTVDGCSRTDSGQVTINPRPAVSISGPTTACSNGLPINFTANPAGGTFSLPNGLPAGAVTVSNNVATLNAGFNITSLTFSYKYTDAATGCDSTASHSITVTSKPNAGTDQTLACADPSANTLTTSTTLVPSPAGGTWSQIGTTPATATITGNNVTNMTVAGTYQFVYSLNGCSDTVAVTVQPCSGCVKPNAGPDANAVCQPTVTAKLTAVTAGGTWAPIGSPANPSAATIDANGNITGLSTAGTYKFVYSVTAGGQTCTDTAQVIVNAKPVIANGTATICAGETVDLTSKITNYATLLSPVWTLTTAGGTAVTTPKAVMPTTTTTYVLVAENAAGCKDTANVVVTVNPKPTIAVANGFPACRTNGTAYTIKFVATGGTVTTVPSLTVTGDSIANIPLTTASVKLIITSPEGCKDSITVTAPVCDKPVGSIGDLIWKDVNDNGLQDLPSEKGVAGVKVNLYAAAAGGTKTGTILQTKTTATDGLYLFSNLAAGDYIVEIDKTSLPDTCQITSKLNIPSDDTKDSDFNPTTGLSQVITLNPVFNPSTPAQQLATNNLTVDAGLTVPCVKSKVTVTAAPVCSADVQSYSLTFSVSNKVGMVKVDKGVLTGSNPYTVTGIPSGATLKITDSLSAICKFDTLITGPNCNCNPPLPILITPSLTACIGDTFPTIKATVVGQATVEWFATTTSTSVLFTGLNYKPTGNVTAAGAMFFAQARSTDPACPTAISTSRVMATINAQNCTVEVDLALRKSINKKIAQIGDELIYTVKVFNQLNVAATGVEVTDSIATTVQFVAGSFTASRGSAAISGNVIKWTIGNIAANTGANGDTVTLTYKVKAILPGIHLNTAEISRANEKDIDSTPGNGKEGEDDIESQCFTVPIALCASEKVQMSVPAKYTNVQWFKNGSTTPIAAGNVVLLGEPGSYTFTANNQTCPTGGCCPIIIVEGSNCCPPQICVPLTIKKIKK